MPFLYAEQNTNVCKQRNVLDQSSPVYPSDNSLWPDYLSFPMSVIKTRVFRKEHLWDESFKINFR